MIKNIKTLRKIRVLIFLLISLLFLNCKKNQNKFYSYKIVNDQGNTIGYYERKVYVDRENRVDSIFKLDKNRNTEKIHVETFLTYKDRLLKNDEIYLSIIKDSCWTYSDIDYEVKRCFLGRENLIIDGVEYKGLYKFKSNQLEIDGLSTEEYYDEDLILLKKEVLKGAVYFKIIRLNK